MKAFIGLVESMGNFLAVIAGVGLTFMMMITVCDVILRYLGRPIPGTYELVAFSGVVVIGFAIAYTSLQKAHVFVDFLVDRMTRKGKIAMIIFTRLLSMGFFLMLGICLIADGISLYQTGEVSPTLKLSFYPIAFGLGICSFTQCMVLLADILKIAGGQHE
jgi:TRAP-type C4-dicarboxylate transport system permease small subunit